ncbi:MAG: AAA family ATPase [Candidatus Norongarragalinales archaeon]
MKILGFAGLFASGKTTAAEHAARLLHCSVYSLGDEVRLALKKKKQKITREALQALSAEEKKKFGNGIWARRLAARIKKTDAKYAVVEGFRNLDEVRVFRSAFGKNFFLIAVTAPIELRYRRAKLRKRECEKTSSLAAFKKSESLEAKGEGWGIKNVNAAADYEIDNSGSTRDLLEKVERAVKRARHNS